MWYVQMETVRSHVKCDPRPGFDSPSSKWRKVVGTLHTPCFEVILVLVQ